MSDVPRKRTVGSLDMGGGSAQIAFEVAKSVSIYMYKESKIFNISERIRDGNCPTSRTA